MVPPKLKQALELFKSLPKELRSQVLLEYAAKVPPPPPGVELERVHECQTPFFVHADVEGERCASTSTSPTRPPRSRPSPASSGRARGESPEAVLEVPPGFYRGYGLEEFFTPLRLRGLEAALLRLQAQVRKALTS